MDAAPAGGGECNVSDVRQRKLAGALSHRGRPFKRRASCRAMGRRTGASSKPPSPSRSTRGQYEFPHRRDPPPHTCGRDEKVSISPQGEEQQQGAQEAGAPRGEPHQMQVMQKWGGGGMTWHMEDPATSHMQGTTTLRSRVVGAPGLYAVA